MGITLWAFLIIVEVLSEAFSVLPKISSTDGLIIAGIATVMFGFGEIVEEIRKVGERK